MVQQGLLHSRGNLLHTPVWRSMGMTKGLASP